LSHVRVAISTEQFSGEYCNVFAAHMSYCNLYTKLLVTYSGTFTA